MSTEGKVVNSSLDSLKWVLALVVFAVAVVGNVYFKEILDYLLFAAPQLTFLTKFTLIYQVFAVVLLMALSAFIALQTTQGKSFVVLVKEANLERRKVVWPTRQETVQTTLIVVVFVVIVGLILWGIDSVLGWMTKMLIG
ncbi:MAG TPA: preprotein translocase subunit SecE [Pseudomonadales bacterium]|nr:preprotein translocase subunit SecE [Pseudomonadales bacterium]